MRWIYISPHFDDAVLSCGGLIWEQTQKGNPVEIWTVCAGDPPNETLSPLARECHLQWGIESTRDLVAARRNENLKAAARVGAEVVDFSIPDCIYRLSPAGEFLYPKEVFVPIHSVEMELDKEIAAAVASELRPDDTIVSPLAIGGHLDHVLTRRAAEHLKRPLWYYADIPYLLNHAEMLAPATRALNNKLHPISEKGLSAWQDAIAAYSTQIPMLFQAVDIMKSAIHSYWETHHGVSLWSKSK